MTPEEIKQLSAPSLLTLAMEQAEELTTLRASLEQAQKELAWERQKQNEGYKVPALEAELEQVRGAVK